MRLPALPATLSGDFPHSQRLHRPRGTRALQRSKTKRGTETYSADGKPTQSSTDVAFCVALGKQTAADPAGIAGVASKAAATCRHISVNIQPQNAAILEGEKEIFLTEQHTLPESFNGIPLFIRPQGFFQTNPLVAEGLYGTAQQWVQDLPINTLWDLFCGVGGFGLHCLQALQQRHTQKTLRLTGIEISASAIAAATLSAQQLGLAEQLSFQSLDAANFALTQAEKPDLIIVNPPRRGVGKTLAEFLNAMQPHFILYSSCNAETMGKDLQSLTHYQSEKIQLFDMFPHTAHYEVLVLLKLHK